MDVVVDVFVLYLSQQFFVFVVGDTVCPGGEGAVFSISIFHRKQGHWLERAALRPGS